MVSLDPALSLAAVLTLSFVFGWAAIGKLTDLDVFRGVVHDYRVLPSPLVGAAALGIPLAELLGAAGILWPAARGPAVWLLMALTVAFTAAVVVNLKRGRTHVDCGCFRSESRQPIGWRLVARNAVLLGAAALCLLETTARAMTWLDLVSAVAAALALTIMYVAVPYTDLRLPALRAELDANDANNARE